MKIAERIQQGDGRTPENTPREISRMIADCIQINLGEQQTQELIRQLQNLQQAH